MSDPSHLLTEEKQRRLQANFWGLPPSATWDQIDVEAGSQSKAPFYYDHVDWRETMRRLYGIEFAVAAPYP